MLEQMQRYFDFSTPLIPSIPDSVPHNLKPQQQPVQQKPKYKGIVT